MTSTAEKDVSLQSDISKMKLEHDGSFKRAAAAFRNFIQKGGRFEPEKGMLASQ
jgi:putative glutathione S-transferase